MCLCRRRVAVLGRHEREQVLIPRYCFPSVALGFAAVGAGFEITGPCCSDGSGFAVGTGSIRRESSPSKAY